MKTARADPCRLVVLTGGPGAGKTAVLEMFKRECCPHVEVLPEAASVVFAGGFWRRRSVCARRAAQRAIFHVQRELERIALEEGRAALALCDRGSLDGLAYWPGRWDAFYDELGISRAREQARYHSVIHLRTPTLRLGYNHANPIRIESARQAAAIDARIALAWEGHPRRLFVEPRRDFLEKAEQALLLIRSALPPHCPACLASPLRRSRHIGAR